MEQSRHEQRIVALNKCLDNMERERMIGLRKDQRQARKVRHIFWYQKTFFFPFDYRFASFYQFQQHDLAARKYFRIYSLRFAGEVTAPHEVKEKRRPGGARVAMSSLRAALHMMNSIGHRITSPKANRIQIGVNKSNILINHWKTLELDLSLCLTLVRAGSPGFVRRGEADVTAVETWTPILCIVLYFKRSSHVYKYRA